MDILSAAAVFLIVWWIVLFTMLPIGVRGQHETGEVVPGSEPGAPVVHDLKRKALWTTAVSIVVTAAILGAVELGAFDFRAG